MSADDTEGIFRVESLAFARPVMHTQDFKDSFLLCREIGVQAVQGMCVVHNSDACLSLYVRYNHVFEVMEKNFKDAMVKTRQAM